jgi:transcriptional regulator with XRE-family HTH domain
MYDGRLMRGRELKARRKALGTTQVELAEILGVQPNTVARWENGVLDVPKVVALAIETVERSSHKNANTKRRPEKKRPAQRS